jgi:hypothetical protein
LFKVKGGIENTKEVNRAGQDRRRSKRSRRRSRRRRKLGMLGGLRTHIYCQPPTGGRIRSQGNKMPRLRRRNHEWMGEWVGVGKGGFMKIMK